MYLDFYGLKEKPFTLSPNPKYLFYSRRHKEAMSQIIYAVTQKDGYMVLSGEVGTGKTTLINALLNFLPEEFIVAKIYHTVLSPKGLIQNICKEFSIEFAYQTMAELVFKLHEYLEMSYYADKKPLLILDEAQNLTGDILEEIRLLSNFEAEHEKFLQILLVGQPELEVKLRTANLSHLRERIGLRFRLEPLSREETRDYINHRLSVAGCQYVGDLFTDEAIEQIYILSAGIPRRINALSDKALLMGYARDSREIHVEIIEKLGVDDMFSETEGTIRRKVAKGSQHHETSPPDIRAQRMYTQITETQEAICAASERYAEQHGSDDKNGKLLYAEFEKLMGNFLLANHLLIIRRPLFARSISVVILIGVVLLLTFMLAIVLTQKLGISRLIPHPS